MKKILEYLERVLKAGGEVDDKEYGCKIMYDPPKGCCMVLWAASIDNPLLVISKSDSLRGCIADIQQRVKASKK